jgi:anti-sigma regulatory factor (Ser/Thr protein kinase)
VGVTVQRVPLPERSAVGEVRRRAAALADDAGLDEEAAGRVAIVATELATNVVKHGGGGHCFLSVTGTGAGAAVQIVAVDTGPGIADPGLALHDGYSTAGTPGTGLGAARRLSRSFDLYTRAGGGVVVVARVGAERPAGRSQAPEPVEVGGVEAPLEGEPESGDGWVAERSGAVTSVLVSDGLGHGIFAAEASAAAIEAFLRHPGLPPLARLERVHESMRSTRGAAVAIAEIDPHARSLRYAGIGNISGQILTGSTSQSLVSMNGTAGHVARTFREFSYDYRPGALLVMHSDGVTGRWSLDDYPGITARDPAVIAALLHRDHARGRDDATVVVARYAASASAVVPT